jgi:hypothetical protein
MIPLPGTKRMAAQLGMHAALFRTGSGRRGDWPCRTFLHVLRGRRIYRVRLVPLDAADPAGQPWSRRLQAAATDGHYLYCAADVRARSDHARCHGGAGAGNGWRIGNGRCLGAATARREQSQIPNEGAEPVARPPGAPAPTGESDELRVPTFLRGVSAHVLKAAKPRPAPSQNLAQIVPLKCQASRAAGLPSRERRLDRTAVLLLAARRLALIAA